VRQSPIPPPEWPQPSAALQPEPIPRTNPLVIAGVVLGAAFVLLLFLWLIVSHL
jgi:hypothetical protein